jgi:transposase
MPPALCFQSWSDARGRPPANEPRLKECRRITTRYDKLAASYLSFVPLAAIRVWLWK